MTPSFVFVDPTFSFTLYIKMAILNELPLELRQAILEYITAGAAAADGDKTHAHASYATVCQEWQAFFERDHFKRLVLSPLCIRDLDKRVQPGRRSLVKHIWLRIELPEHICRDRGVEDAKRDFDLVSIMFLGS